MKRLVQSMVVVGTVLCSGAAFAQAPAPQAGTTDTASKAQATDPSATHAKHGSEQLHQHMQQAAQKMGQMQMSGDLETDFMTSMRQHHLDGIAMSKMTLEHAKDPKVRQFAQKVIKMQQKDVKEIDAWLAKHGKAAVGGSGTEGMPEDTSAQDPTGTEKPRPGEGDQR